VELEFSQHGLEQIRRRGISKTRVKKAIQKADNQQATFKGRRIFQKRFGKKLLEVVVIEEAEKLVIITAYYLYENKLRSKN